MLDACNDARNKAEASPQIYNAWGIRYMVYLSTSCITSSVRYPYPIRARIPYELTM